MLSSRLTTHDSRLTDDARLPTAGLLYYVMPLVEGESLRTLYYRTQGNDLVAHDSQIVWILNAIPEEK